MIDLTSLSEAANTNLGAVGIDTSGLFTEATVFSAILPDPTKPSKESGAKLYITLAEGQSTEIKIVIPTVECHAA